MLTDCLAPLAPMVIPDSEYSNVYLKYFLLINNNLDNIELNKKRRDTKLIARRFKDILSSLSSDRKNSVLKFKGANIQYVNLNEQFCP